jgi:DNA-binding SARP family transcriptional activator
MRYGHRKTPNESHAAWLARPPILGQLLSAAGLLALLVGVPILLVASQASPPLQELVRAVTHPQSWGHELNRPLGDHTVVKIVAFVAWAVWLWLALCIGVELLANVRGVPTMRLPISRYGQSLAAFLVGASFAFPSVRVVPQLRFQAVEAVMARPMVSGRVPSVAYSRNDAPAWLDTEFDSRHPQTFVEPPSDPRSENDAALGTSSVLREPAVSEAPEAAEPAETTATASGTYVVVPGDTLWSIATRELGSPLRWRELAALNMGRLQPDGRRLTDAHWIFPGWVLVLPTSASLGITPASATAASASFAAGGLDAAPAVQDPPLLPSRATATNPRTTQFGAGVLLPPVGVHDQPTPQEPAKAGPSHGAFHGAKIRSPSHRGAPVPIVPIGYGVLGAVVIAVIDRMRRAQQRHRRSGLRITLPDSDLAELERGLRLGADPEAVEWVDLGQRLLSSRTLGNSGSTPPPRIVAVRLRTDALELLIDPSCYSSPSPEPFIADSRGTSWVLPREPELLDGLARDPQVVGAGAPLPGLVTLGRDERGLLLLNVERAGSLAISGAEAGSLAQAMVIEMACSRWSDQVDIVLVGEATQVDVLERVSHAPSVADVIQRLERRVLERRTLLEIVHRSTNFETRWVEGGDAWDLCVVFCMPEASMTEPEAVDELIRLAGEGSYGLAVVCVSETSTARTRVRANGGPLSFDMDFTELAGIGGTAMWPQCVERGFADGVASLVDVAGHMEGVPPGSPPYDEIVTETPMEPGPTRASSVVTSEQGSKDTIDGVRGSDSDASTDHTQEVEVHVLGPVEIVGAARPFTRAWAIELVVYLAMHRNGASTDQWATALWPDRVMAPASLHSTASAARRALGISRSGEDHLPRSHGRLALGAGVKTDWDGFVRLSRLTQPQEWRSALELVRGRPFEGVRVPDWALLEGITATIEAVVVDVSCRYAELCLSNSNPAEAEWAARQGLRVSAYDERLYRVLMRAADVAGNPAGVESVMSELTHLVADDIEPFDAVHPETLELYRSLSRRSSVPRGR